MLEKPAIPDELILTNVLEHYNLQPTGLKFLPLGYDINTAVYRIATVDGRSFFLKLRKGNFDQLSVLVPGMLTNQGIASIIAPLKTKERRLWADLGDFRLILYPFIEGQDGYQTQLSDQQWCDLGAALNVVHSIRVPPELIQLLPQESYSPYWREMVKYSQEQVEEKTYVEPVAKKLAAFMRTKRDEITSVVEHARTLGQALQRQSPKLVLCHGDFHPGNLLISPGGPLYIVDWDNPVLAPKEKDLALIGGCHLWSSPALEALFYHGYEPAEINPTAIAYFRFERIVQDIAAFCQQLLLTDVGGDDREQSYQYFTSIFDVGHEIDLTKKPLLTPGYDLRENEPGNQPTPQNQNQPDKPAAKAAP